MIWVVFGNTLFIILGRSGFWPILHVSRVMIVEKLKDGLAHATFSLIYE